MLGERQLGEGRNWGTCVGQCRRPVHREVRTEGVRILREIDEMQVPI